MCLLRGRGLWGSVESLSPMATMILFLPGVDTIPVLMGGVLPVLWDLVGRSLPPPTWAPEHHSDAGLDRQLLLLLGHGDRVTEGVQPH